MNNKIRFKYLKTKHSWHLVDPSPWPLFASLGAFFMTSGAVLYMNKFLGGSQLALIGFFLLLYVMYTYCNLQHLILHFNNTLIIIITY